MIRLHEQPSRSSIETASQHHKEPVTHRLIPPALLNLALVPDCGSRKQHKMRGQPMYSSVQWPHVKPEKCPATL
ncbi:hypothetical protein IG631_16912 [Alternaria alternata]|nr:hypothetical protein IG631_16912 [Alternaria alternata]